MKTMKAFERSFSLLEGIGVENDFGVINALYAALWCERARRGYRMRHPMIVITGKRERERRGLAARLAGCCEVGPMFCKWTDQRSIKESVNVATQSNLPMLVAGCSMKKLDDKCLSRFLTSPTLSVRRPWSKEYVDVPNGVVVIVHARELALSPDLERRCIRIRLGVSDDDIPF